MGGACSGHGRDEGLIQDFGRKPARKEALGSCRGSWEDNIRMDVREIVWKDVEWIHLA